MNEDFARGKCPVCGCETPYRKNKNGILYTICHNGHRSKFNRDDSIAAVAKIASGSAWNNGIIYLYPMNGVLKGKEENGRTEQATGTTTGTNATSSRTGSVQSTTNDGNAVSGTSSGTVQTDGTAKRQSDDDITGWL